MKKLIQKRKIIQDRWYQDGCADALFEASKIKDCHPIGAIPTAGGKTTIVCKLVDKILSHDPNENILVLSHVAEILEQDYTALREFFEWDDDAGCVSDYSMMGLYGNSLGARDIKKITVAQIQSVWRNPEKFSHFTKIIIDECHLINTKEAGMYRKFLGKLDANYVGVTATPYRTGYGRIHEGEGALFTDLVYDLTSMENFNRLVDEGYLSQLISKKTALLLDDKVKTIGGDFSTKELAEKNDREEITKAAVLETIAWGKDYRKWLFFAIDIDHAENITRILNENGIKAIAVHSNMTRDRKEVLAEFKRGEWRAVVNVDVLTTGFDDPEIDLIAQMRPTKSPIFHVQSTGRGLRVVYAEGYDLDTIKGRRKAIKNGLKPHCLILDFAGNTKRLGPINDIVIESKKKKKSSGQMMAKDCPECQTLNHLSAKECISCGFEFPRREKLQLEADHESDIVKKEVERFEKVMKITSIKYTTPYNHRTSSRSLQVTYVCGLTKIKHSVNLDGRGQDRHYARRWVELHWKKKNGEMPDCMEDLKYCLPLLKIPLKMKVIFTDNKTAIVDYQFKKGSKNPNFKKA